MCFEFLQGNEAGASLHLASGLQIVRSIHDGTIPLGIHGTSASRGSLKDDVLQVFATMDMHAATWLGVKDFGLPKIPIVPSMDQRYIYPSPAKDFSSLEEAAISIISQMNQIFLFQRSFSSAEKWDPTSKTFLDAFTERERLSAQLEQWPTAFELLLVQLRESLSPEDLHLVGVMSMNYKLAHIILRATLETDEAKKYAELEPEFAQIVALATSLLESGAPIDKNKPSSLPLDFPKHKPSVPGGSTSVFQFVVGLIAPLYYTAIKCRNRTIVHEAMALLSLTPWREGAWDSVAMARIAQRKIRALEMQGWYVSQAKPLSLRPATLVIPIIGRHPLPASSSYVYMKLNGERPIV